MLISASLEKANSATLASDVLQLHFKLRYLGLVISLSKLKRMFFFLDFDILITSYLSFLFWAYWWHYDCHSVKCLWFMLTAHFIFLSNADKLKWSRGNSWLASSLVLWVWLQVLILLNLKILYKNNLKFVHIWLHFDFVCNYVCILLKIKTVVCFVSI